MPGGGRFLFSGESKSRTWFYARVGLWELMKQRLLRSFSLLVGGFEQSVFVFWFVLLFGMLLGVWGNTGLLF